ncbi:MAG: DNA mismatch repair protein MutS [Acidobacteria bacterium]|nr:MAG: DNA mismatch repair protein MutS [Acidobacteriota bacterium]PYU72579.1 MAG: DNA mismatch repair protein MutS [Acidobacteriota bacterium]
MSEPTTPLMQQYHAIKARYPHALLLFRLGDFYELFYEDAIIAARELQITLTSRNREKGQPIPMCGVPYHAAEGYIARLIRAGFKIAICDQMEQPGPGKKLVRRDVVRIITPGTATDGALLDARENNFLASVAKHASGSPIGLAFVDLSTGEFQATEFSGADADDALRDQLQLLHPRETLLPRPQQLFEGAPLEGVGGVESHLEDWIFQREYAERILREQFDVAELTGFGFDDRPQALSAAGAIVHYLRENAARGDDAANGDALRHLDRVRYYELRNSLVLDPVSVRNLELLAPIFLEESTRSPGPTTLIAALDVTVTGMGARLLRSWLLRPLIDPEAIEARLAAVTHLVQQTVVRGEIRKELKGILDLERLTGRITLGLAAPRELVALRKSLTQLPVLKNFLTPPPAGGSELLRHLHEEIDELADVRERLERAIADEPPALATDPGMIRSGYNPELDELRDLSQRSKQIIAAMEERERKRSGIGSLKIRYNQIFGYYIEISKPNLHLAPADYERKQTLVNAERFTSTELREYERKILAADERILEIERQLFIDVRSSVASQAARLRRTAAAVAQLDVLTSFAKLAADRGYSRPELSSAGELLIIAGRHPVIEELLRQKGERFVPNDLCFEPGRQQLLLITGPNMGGKSTYLRQSALIVLMAQIGSFVPARQAKLPITDRIFTRIGASDNLARGRSTFLVEMSEVAAILNHATPASLVLLDEVGRGTATFDGLSIAWAVVEHLQKHIRARTLFATHYHELTELADLLPAVKNVHVSAKETPSEIIFLRRVEPGSADKSYGIEVARLAGLPHSVIKRAREVLKRHEQSEHELSETLSPVGSGTAHKNGNQEVLFTALDHQVLEKLRGADLDQLKPLDALNLLAELKKQIS